MLLVLVGICGSSVSAETSINVRTALDRPISITKLDLGVTLNQNSLRHGGNPEAMRRASELLKASGDYVNQFIMGWGTLNPEPSPHEFDWRSLDARMALLRSSGAIPVLTLCCAPDWMRGESAGQTNWKQIDLGLRPEHFDDYVDLVQQISRRYPDVKYYQVWSEFKGFWGRDPRSWDVREFTVFYNKIYDALKAISAEIKVGGPYTPAAHWLNPPAVSRSPISGPYGTIDSRPLAAFEYWLQHRHGADFVSIDGGIAAKDGLVPDLFAAGAIFTDATKWVLQRTALPIWWSEWYASPNDVDDTEQSALMASALIRFAPFVSVALKWAPEGDAQRDRGDQESLWTDTTVPNGGKPLPFFAVLQRFRHCFPSKTQLIEVSISSSHLAALSSRTCTMLVNQTAATINAELNNRPVTLTPYETKFEESP
jgi:hypothetical protein